MLEEASSEIIIKNNLTFKSLFNNNKNEEKKKKIKVYSTMIYKKKR